MLSQLHKPRLATLWGLAVWLISAAAPSSLAPKPVEQWRLTGADFSEGAFASQVDGRVLRFGAEPEFVGEGEHQALLLPAGSPFLVVDSRAAPASLPERSLSVEAWVALDEAGEWGGILGALEDNGSFERGWMLGSRGNQFAFAVASEDTGTLTYLRSKTVFRPGRWYHVVGTYDGKVQELYVDGALEAESTAQGGDVLYAEAHHFVAGAYKDANEEYRLVGALHEVALYDRAMGARDVRRRYEALEGELPPPASASFTGLASAEPPVLREMQPAINDAILRGVDRLLLEQHRDGSWSRSIEQYRNGQTALCVYTLLKSGVHLEHPSIQRALDFLRREPPRKVYSAGFQLLALAATGDPRNLPWAREIATELVDWESDVQPGGWAYPGGRVDISNTQLVALGLWAASTLGAETSPRVWQRMVRSALEDHQEEPTTLRGERGLRRGEMAGFTYYKGGATYPASGSMATAGLCVLALGEQVAGKKLGARLTRQARTGSERALEWMAENWTLSRNPGYVQDEGYYYYLYGIERVGAFFELERIGEHLWYPEGARELIKRQEEDGSWGREEETCFALLFLGKATHSKTGPRPPRERPSQATEGADVVLRATGTDTVTLWIDGFAEEVTRRFEYANRRLAGLRILQVEYWIDGSPLKSAEHAPGQRWAGERFAVQHRFTAPGLHRFEVRVQVIPAGADETTVYQPITLSSGELEVEASIDARAWMERLRALEGENQLSAGTRLKVSATSQLDGHPAGLAVDSLEATCWLSATGDERPSLTIELARPTPCSALRLGPAASRLSMRDTFDRVRRLAVTVNGGAPLEVEIPPGTDELDPIQVELPEPVRLRRLEVSILEREASGSRPGVTGLAEVQVLGP